MFNKTLLFLSPYRIHEILQVAGLAYLLFLSALNSTVIRIIRCYDGNWYDAEVNATWYALWFMKTGFSCSISVQSSWWVFTFLSGTGLFPFSCSEVYPTTTLTNPMWPGVVKTKQDSKLYDQHLLDKQNAYPGSSSNSYGAEGKQFNFLQTVPEASACLPFHKTVAASSESCFSTQVSSNCALSLLSSPPPPLQPPEISFKNHMLPLPPPSSIPLAHSINSRLHTNNLGSMDSLMVPASSDTGVHCQGMFHMGRDSSSENDVSQTLPFCWE